MEESTQPDTVIRASGTEHLNGLTVLGKFEPPAESSRRSEYPARKKSMLPAAVAMMKVHQEANDILEAQIVSRNTGGYVATVLGYDAFMPGSHSTVRMASVMVEDDPLIGTAIPVLLLEIKPISRQLVISHREAKQLIAQRKREAEEADKLAKQQAHEALLRQKAVDITWVTVGDIIEAKVYNNTNPKFVALRAGSLTVRVGMDELGWGRDKTLPSVDEQLQVVITYVDKEKLLLHGSIRLLSSDPWLTAAEKYPAGFSTTAKIYDVASFGLFVEVEPGIDGLLHHAAILSLYKELKLSEHFAVGDEVPVTVDYIDTVNERLSLSLSISLDSWPRYRDLHEQHKTITQQLGAANKLAEKLQEQVSDQGDSQALLLSAHADELALLQQQHNAREEELVAIQVELKDVNAQLQSKEQQLATHTTYTQSKIDSLLSEVKQLHSELSSTKLSLNQAQTSYQQSQAVNRQLEQQSRTVAHQLAQAQQEAQQLNLNAQAELEVDTWSEQELTTITDKSAVAEDSPPVYITFSNSKQITAGIDWSRENLEGEVYPVPFPHFNHLERRQLLAYKRLCEYPNHFLASMADRVRNGSGNMLLANKPPAFHKTQQCKFAHSDYTNYIIPEEVKLRGQAAVEAFRKWFAQKLEQNPRYLEREHLMEPLMVECMQHFKLSAPPLPIKIANTGLVAMRGQDLAFLERQIEKQIADAASYARENDLQSNVINRLGTHSYKGAKPSEPLQHGTPLTDAQVRAILSRYENDYKKVLITLLQTYYQSKFNNQLAFDGSLLIGLGFRPCYACFNKSDLSSFTPQSLTPIPQPLRPPSRRPVRSSHFVDDDNDLPF